MNNQTLEHIQKVIGYRFQNWDLLQQAFVRCTYSEENGGENNEVLEFIGDKVLDLVVVKLLTEKYGFMVGNCEDFDESEECDEFACEKDEAELTEIKRQLVQKNYLAQQIDRLELAEYLITGKGDNSYNNASVKEDLFEAIIGAAAIDSNWDMDELQNLVETMLDPDSILEEAEDNYISLIQDWTAKKGIGVPCYEFGPCGNVRLLTGQLHISQTQVIEQSVMANDPLNKDAKFQCLLRISEELLPFGGFGCSHSEARRNACETAFKYLEREGLLFSIKDEIQNPNKDEAISQLEILSRRRYFSIPVYDFREDHDENGNPVWECRCKIKEHKYVSNAISSKKKDAKKTAAFDMLIHIIGEG